VLAHIRQEQAGGRRRAALLTGSLEPLVADLAARLGVGVVATVPALAGRTYTGRVVGRICIGEEKRERMLLAAAAAGAGAGGDVAGMGNSMYDAPFLAAVDRAAVVRPGRRLRRLAAQEGWDLSLAAVRAGGEGSGGGGGPAAAAARSFELCVGAAWALIAAGGCALSGRLRQRYSRA
jgi:phosphoserine phosphatase